MRKEKSPRFNNRCIKTTNYHTRLTIFFKKRGKQLWGCKVAITLKVAEEYLKPSHWQWTIKELVSHSLHAHCNNTGFKEPNLNSELWIQSLKTVQGDRAPGRSLWWNFEPQFSKLSLACSWIQHTFVTSNVGSGYTGSQGYGDTKKEHFHS